MSVTGGAPPVQAPARGAHDLEARLIATIPQVFRHLLAHARRRSPTWKELTYQQYNVLRMIQAEGPMAPAEIARRLLVTAPVVTRLATGLVRADLVERVRDPRDRRSVRLTLTREGRRRATAMRRDLVAAAAELIESLPADRRAAVAAALDELQVLLPGRGTTR
ncbi:MAG TPA: MarR family transcriptional regulator [Candidatus Limnocylindria bacterium]|nr:MarR family transcriptional regulator [Candidatus Limnocylindria bacterium]